MLAKKIEPKEREMSAAISELLKIGITSTQSIRLVRLQDHIKEPS